MDTSIIANSYRSRQAMSVLGARPDEFKINEFGDEGTVCFKDLERALQSNKIPDAQKKNVSDLTNLFESRKVSVMTPRSERATTKPPKPKLGFLEGVGATFAFLFNVPTKARAHRMQNEMEYSFGCAAANMVNLSYLKASDQENSGIKKAQDGIRKNLEQFFKKTDWFVARYKLDKADANAAEKCENQIVSRLVNSLKDENGKFTGDTAQLKVILEVARNWSAPASANEAERKMNDRIDRVMNALATEIEARLEAVKAAEAAEAPPPPTGLKGLIASVKNSLKTFFESWKNSLKSTFDKKLEELKELCNSIGGEMDDIKSAFENLSKDLEKELNKDIADFNHKDINEQAIKDAVKSMDDKVGQAIAKGREIIDARMRKELAGHKQELRYKLFLGSGGIAKMDVGKTNKILNVMLKHAKTTVEDAQKIVGEEKDISLDYVSKKINELNTNEATKKLENTKLLSTKAITVVNDTIGAFAAARAELMHVIRPTVAKIELANQLEKKESNPPGNVDRKVWQEACQAVGKFIQDDKSNNLYHMPSQAVGLIREHKDYFLEGLGDDAKKRLEHVLGFQDLNGGFDLTELDHLGYGDKLFVNSCNHMTGQFYGELLDNINRLDEKAYNKDPNDTEVDRSIKDGILKFMSGKLDDTFVVADSPQIRTDVVDTKENRENGVFFDTIENGVVTKSWISNEDAERLATRLGLLIGQVDFWVAHKSAQLLQGKIDAPNAAGDTKQESLVFEDIKLDGSSSAWNDEYSKMRLAQIGKAQEYLKPLVTAYRDARAIVAVNALERLRTDIRAIRSAIASNDEIVRLCNAAERAMDTAGSDVGKSVKALDKLYEKITNDKSLANDASLGVDLEKFCDNICRLTYYGEHGNDVFSGDVGNIHLNRTVKLMDNLTIGHKRSRDIVNLVSDSLESVRNLVMSVGNSVQFKSDWFSTVGLSNAHEKLRKNFSDYTKSVTEYVKTLADEYLVSDSPNRETAAENVRKSLAACYSSLAPIVGFLNDYETFVADQFERRDSLKTELDSKLAQAAEKEHPNDPAKQKEYIRANQHDQIDKKLKDKFPVCYNTAAAEVFTETREAIENVFLSIGEISRSMIGSFEDLAQEDDLNISSTQDQQSSVGSNKPPRNGAFDRSIDTGGISLLKLGYNEVLRKYRNHFNYDSLTKDRTAERHGLVFYDMFGHMNFMYNLLSKAKIANEIPDVVIKNIGDIVAKRKLITTEDDLVKHLQNAVSKKDLATFKNIQETRQDNEISAQALVLSAKSSVFGIDKEFGYADRERFVISLNEHLEKAGVKNYSITAVDTVEDAISRVAVKNKDGDESYYTLNFDGKKITFSPEVNTRVKSSGNFKDFRVDQDVYKHNWKDMKQELVSQFPFEYVDRGIGMGKSFVVGSPAQ